MICPSCGGTTRKYAICGRCRADRDRWARPAEKIRKANAASKCPDPADLSAKPGESKR